MKYVLKILSDYFFSVKSKKDGNESSSSDSDEDSVEAFLRIDRVTLTGKGPNTYYPSDNDLKFAPTSIFVRKNIASSENE